MNDTNKQRLTHAQRTRKHVYDACNCVSHDDDDHVYAFRVVAIDERIVKCVDVHDATHVHEYDARDDIALNELFVFTKRDMRDDNDDDE